MARYGKNRLFDDDDEEEDEPGSFGHGGGVGGAHAKNPFDDDADDNLLRMRAQISHHEDACLESTKVHRLQRVWSRNPRECGKIIGFICVSANRMMNTCISK